MVNKEHFHQRKAEINIGKRGLEKPVIEEIKKRLEKHGIVKVKILRTGIVASGLERRELARTVAEETGARLIGIKGRTFILAKKKKREAEGE
ncbi:MAG: YhbY family RNA-binding protein [Desulfurococcales archaeon]|nr:YhbY family RNA-binding protein [Desulfurococcales archaeon]